MEKYNSEQLRKKFQEIDKSIKSRAYENEGFMAHNVFRKRLGLIVFGEYLPQYDALSDEDKQNFGFDVDGLVKKVKDLLN